MQVKKVFLASSSELKHERIEFELAISRRNRIWEARGFKLELLIWEDFIDAMSSTRLQDEYNKAIKGSDIFVMLFHTKVGKYTGEEFETAFQVFQENKKPLIYTYFNTSPAPADTSERDRESLQAFKDKLRELKHFKTEYANIGELKYHFSDQIDKLEVEGFFKPSTNPTNGASADHPPEVDLFVEIRKKIPYSRSLLDLVEEYEARLTAIDPDSENELLLFKAQWNRLEQNKRAGIISEENSTIQSNKLNNTFLNILSNIERMAK